MKIKNQLNKWRTGKNNEQMNDAKKSNNNLNKSKKNRKKQMKQKNLKKKEEKLQNNFSPKRFFPIISSFGSYFYFFKIISFAFSSTNT